MLPGSTGSTGFRSAGHTCDEDSLYSTNVRVLVCKTGCLYLSPLADILHVFVYTFVMYVPQTGYDE